MITTITRTTVLMAALCLVFLLHNALAQGIGPITVTHTSGELHDGADITFYVEAGTEAEQVAPCAKATIEFQYEGFQLDTSVTKIVAASDSLGSWFWDSSAWLEFFEIDTANRTITVILKRPSGDSIGGWGPIVNVSLEGGIIVVPDPIYRYGVVANNPTDFFVRAQRKVLLISDQYLYHSKIHITDTQGRCLLDTRVMQNEYSLSNLPAGTYYIRLIGNKPSELKLLKVALQ